MSQATTVGNSSCPHPQAQARGADGETEAAAGEPAQRGHQLRVPVGGLQEQWPLIHLLGHVHIILTSDGHGARLPTQVLCVVVHVVRVLPQLGKVVDLE